jgi:diguanylate cyclase (GGDEF)-like protein
MEQTTVDSIGQEERCRQLNARLRRLRADLLTDVDTLAEALGRISMGEFDAVIGRVGLEELDTLRVGVQDMARRLKATNAEMEASIEGLRRSECELKRHRDLLERWSMRDGLTGIANRRSFDEHLDVVWRQAARERSAVAVILADIDHFKAYNDHYGHLAGDECLRRVAGAMAVQVRRPTDKLARFGGEEFVCVLPGTGIPGAVTVGEAMRAAIEALGIPYARSAVAPHVTISLGVAACVPQPGQPAEHLLERADRALYAAKRASRNTLGVHDRVEGAGDGGAGAAST